MHCSGADPKQAKAAYAAHHSAANGRTTLSASAALLPGGSWALAPLAPLYPFLPPGARRDLVRIDARTPLPGTDISVWVGAHPRPTPAQLAGTLQLPALLDWLHATLAALGAGSPAGWKLGWRLAHQAPAEAATPELASTWMLLRLSRPALLDASPRAPSNSSSSSAGEGGHRAHSAAACSPAGAACCSCCGDGSGSVQAGQPVRIVGSPFGCLAPLHFHNSVVEGCVSSVLRAASPSGSGGGSGGGGGGDGGPGSGWQAPLFLVDGVVHPGMEGALILCRCVRRWGRAAHQPGCTTRTGFELAPCWQQCIDFPP